MTIEEAARWLVFWRRMKADLKAERYRLHEKCTANDADETWSSCCLWYEDLDGHRTFNEDRREWCDVCLASDVVHEWYRIAAAKAGGAMRALQRALLRADSA